MPILPSGSSVSLPGDGLSNRYARKLLETLGASVITAGAAPGTHPARRWADSGLMFLTSAWDGEPRICPVPLPSCADGALDAFRALATANILPAVAGAHLLTERVAMSANRRNGSGAGGDRCRLLEARDGWIVLNLARDDDWDLLPAWLASHDARDWDTLAGLVRATTTGTLVERGRLLGLAVADTQAHPTGQPAWLNVVHRAGGTREPGHARAPRVIDLSSLWAGPLCSHLWQAAGADVIKIEGTRRPDGARAGSRDFFELLNRGKRCISLDLHTAAGQRELHTLISRADIVLEGSRPRALRQMGIVAEELIEAHPNLTWVSITGYGRQEPQANWIAYGDDAGVAAGLSAILHQVSGEWLICGDAVADPLTGLHAAVAGWASWRAGGGCLIELSLEQTVRYCITATEPRGGDYHGRQARWTRYLEDNHIVAKSPQRRNGG